MRRLRTLRVYFRKISTEKEKKNGSLFELPFYLYSCAYAYFSTSFQTRALAPTIAASPCFSFEGKTLILFLKIGSR